jgi:hypothetical protein
MIGKGILLCALCAVLSVVGPDSQVSSALVKASLPDMLCRDHILLCIQDGSLLHIFVPFQIHPA